MFLLHIIGYDIWFYISHILLHTKYLYHLHKPHHKSSKPIYYDAFIASNEENIIQILGVLTPNIIYEIHPYQLLSALAFITLRGMMRHDERFNILIGNHHLVHHETFNYNYGEFWLDYTFGTNHPDISKRVYGIFYY